VKLPSPLDDWGVVKGLLLRHFRWWATKPDMFNMDGTLTIGFTYPNMYMSEDYNSPQSPYWGMKSFLALGLSESHPFWTVKEKPLPRSNAQSVLSVHPPMHVICDTGNHHFLLSMGQYCPWPLKATEAKYGKFAYSSHFGFSVPTGTLIQQVAPDSTLALSKDGGDTWRVPWYVSEHRFGTTTVRNKTGIVEIVPTLRSKWKPWKDAMIEVTTHLLPPTKRWPDWYVRIHEIRNGGAEVKIQCVQGGFSIQGRGAQMGESLPTATGTERLATHESGSFSEGIKETSYEALICSNAGASGIRAICVAESEDHSGQALKPDANTNLMWQRTLIPTIKSELIVKESGFLASAVFALSRTSDREERYSSIDIGELWDDVPCLATKAGSKHHIESYISTDELDIMG
jgi:hypothetical protein